MESGAALKFTFISESNAALKETSLEHLCAVEFDGWVNDAAAMYAEWKAVFEKIGNSPIAAHTVGADPALRLVTYENGYNIAINYGEESAEIEGLVVPALGYICVGPDGSIVAITKGDVS